MLRFLCAALFCLSFASAQAQQGLSNYDSRTIDSSIKCELSRVAKLFGPQRASGPVMQAVVTVKGTETVTKKIGGNFIIGGNYQTDTSTIRGFKGTRNINVDNSINCRKTNIVDVGLYSCFSEERDIFLGGQTVTCGGTSSASADFSLGGKITWFVEVSLSSDFMKKREWSIDIQAPPDRK